MGMRMGMGVVLTYTYTGNTKIQWGKDGGGDRKNWCFFLLSYCNTLDCFVVQHHPTLSGKGWDGAGLLATTDRETIFLYIAIALLPVFAGNRLEAA